MNSPSSLLDHDQAVHFLSTYTGIHALIYYDHNCGEDKDGGRVGVPILDRQYRYHGQVRYVYELRVGMGTAVHLGLVVGPWNHRAVASYSIIFV